jgi:hypothetical protein
LGSRWFSVPVEVVIVPVSLSGGVRPRLPLSCVALVGRWPATVTARPTASNKPPDYAASRDSHLARRYLRRANCCCWARHALSKQSNVVFDGTVILA